jgi:hypothetical protein
LEPEGHNRWKWDAWGRESVEHHDERFGDEGYAGSSVAHRLMGLDSGKLRGKEWMQAQEAAFLKTYGVDRLVW